MRTNTEKLLKQGAPSGLNQESLIRLYKEDIFKIIGDGSGNFKEVLKIF